MGITLLLLIQKRKKKSSIVVRYYICSELWTNFDLWT